jgi:deazaflavin-dependent oxidoreductase (nitroreductase family)
LIDQLDATVNWGREKMPSWYYNLRATPRASVLVDGKQKVYSVREAQAEEYEHYWKLAEATYLGMSKYRQRVGERRIPIMILSEENQ